MSSAIDSAKDTAEKGKAAYADARERWPWFDHLLNTVERYTDRRGNTHAAAICFNGILALVPIIMVGFAIAAFVLNSRPELLADLKDAAVDAVPGDAGDQIGDVIDSAIASRAAVGVVGLVGATFTGIGWIAGVREALTEMYGGRVKRSAVMSKLGDLATFILLGIALAGTFVLTGVVNSFASQILDFVGLGDASWAPPVLRLLTTLLSLSVAWMLFTFIHARLPLIPLPFRNALKAGLVTAIAFEIIKAVGETYLRSVMSSPAGAAFGPILGIMVFAFLASRIVLYTAAWCATDPINEPYQVVEESDIPPPVIRPTYHVSPAPKAGTLIGVAGIGAAITAVLSWVLRR